MRIAGRSSTFAAKRLTIGLRLPDLDVGLQVQPLLMRRSCASLITDAAERTPDGGAVILAVGFGGDGRLDLSIRDTGPDPTLGSSGPARASTITARMLISRGARRRRMGLMIVRALMESIGGQLEVANTSGRGSEIHLLFPMHLVTREERRLRRRALAAD